MSFRRKFELISILKLIFENAEGWHPVCVPVLSPRMRTQNEGFVSLGELEYVPFAENPLILDPIDHIGLPLNVVQYERDSLVGFSTKARSITDNQRRKCITHSGNLIKGKRKHPVTYLDSASHF